MPLLLAPCPRCGRDVPTTIRARPGATVPRLAEVTLRCPDCAQTSLVPGASLRLRADAHG